MHLSQHQSANTFAAVLALDDPMGPSPSFWAGTAPMSITITATNDINSGGATTLFIGGADKVSINWEDRHVHLSGRDLTSKLTDKKTNEKWLNKQPQDIIQDLAGRAGLSVTFGGTAVDRAGLKFKDDYNRISELDSYWNVIVRLAKELGCIAYVSGTTLKVEPWDFSGGGNYPLIYVPPTPGSAGMGSMLTLETTRDLQVAKSVAVNHKSWQHKQGQAIESEYMASGAGDELRHELKGANLTKQQQDAIAKGRIDEIISHERTLRATLPGDVSVQPGMNITLSGTQTAFDQSYVISDVEHHFSWAQGYIMTLSVRNKSTGRAATKVK